MSWKSMKIVLVTLLAVAVLVVLLRIVPVGQRQVQLITWDKSQSLTLSWPRYLVPREILFNGFPAPGGDFGIEQDPGFAISRLSSGEIQDENGQSVAILVGGLSVNPDFKKHSAEYLIVGVGGESFKIKLADAPQFYLYKADAITVLGKNAKTGAVLVAAVPYNIENHFMDLVVIEILSPIGQDGANVYSEFHGNLDMAAEKLADIKISEATKNEMC